MGKLIKSTQLIFLCMFYTFVCNSQISRDSIALDTLWSQLDTHFSQPDANFQTAIQLLEELKNDNPDIVYTLYADFYRALFLEEIGKSQIAKELLDQMHNKLQINKVKFNTSSIYSSVHFSLGKFYHDHHLNYGKSLTHYKQCKKLIAEGAYCLHPTSSLFNNLGIIYKKLGDYNSAIEHYEAALNVSSNNNRDIATTCSNIAVNSVEIGDYTKAIQYLQKALQYIRKVKNKNSVKKISIDIFNNFGKLYIETDSIDKANGYLEKVNKIGIKDNKRKLTYYRNKALASLKLKEYSKAQTYLNNAVACYFQDSIIHHRIGIIYHIYGDLYQEQKKYDKAIDYYQKALTVFGKNFTDNLDAKNNPIEAKFGLSEDLLKTLEAKATAFTNIKKYQLALSTYQKAIQIFDNLRLKNISNIRSKYFWAGKTKSLYEKAIALAIQLEKKELAYQFCQKSHATLLWEMLQDLEAKQIGGISDSLLQKEISLKKSIALEELKTKQMPADKARLFQHKEDLKYLQQQLKKEYPQYYQIKYQLPLIELSEVQKKLSSNTALVEYFIGANNIYTFVVTEQNFKVYSHPKPDSFLEYLSNIRKIASQNTTNPTTFNTFKQAAYQLYEILIKDIIIDFPVENFLIIPDEELGYLNFGLLLSNISTAIYPRYDQLPYLIRKYNFSYNYSSALFAKPATNHKKNNALKSLVGFAPVFPGSPSMLRQGQHLDSLLNNLPEVEYIQEVIGGIIYKDTSATLNNFKTSNQQYKIGHLATHATCEDQHPERSSIHFADTTLSCNEIYNLDFNYELVVLSACETGTGKLQKGEGIISLARAFMSAGCPSVVTSLWQVNDKSTADIMKSFYENLADQQLKHIALANTQRTYLQQANPSTAHPFYWAPFIAIGNMDRISTDGISWVYYGLFALAIFIFFFFWLRS